MDLIQVSRFIEADLVFIFSKKRYDEKYDWVKASYSFVENIYVFQRCTDEGVVLLNWDAHSEYGACKLEGIYIMFIDPKFGWVRDVIATEKYINMLAEKELLDVVTCDR